MRKIVIGIAIVLVTFLDISSLKAEQRSPETCEQVLVDYERDCGKVVGRRSLHSLEKSGDCAIIEINAKSRWNASGILFEKDVPYRITVFGGNEDFWCDASIKTTAEGWNLSSLTNIPQTDNECTEGDESFSPPGRLGGWWIRFFEFFRRDSERDWFHLMGKPSADTVSHTPINFMEMTSW